jgi:hypothetical protein
MSAFYQNAFDRLCAEVNLRVLPSQTAPPRRHTWALLHPSDLRLLASSRVSLAAAVLHERAGQGEPEDVWRGEEGLQMAIVAAGGAIPAAAHGTMLTSILPDGVSMRNLRDIVTGLAAHYSSMSFRDRIRLILADRIIHEPWAFAVLSGSHSTARYGLLGTLKNLLVGPEPDWSTMRGAASSISLSQRAKGLGSGHGVDAVEAVAALTLEAKRRQATQASRDESGSSSLIRFAFRDPPSRSSGGPVPSSVEEQVLRKHEVNDRLVAAARESPLLGALLAKHGGVEEATRGIASRGGGSLGVVQDAIASITASSMSHLEQLGAKARHQVTHGRTRPIDRALHAPIVLSPPDSRPIGSHAFSHRVGADWRVSLAATANPSMMDSLVPPIGGKGTVALLEAVAFDIARSDTSMVAIAEDPVVSRVIRETVSAAEESLRALPSESLAALVPLQDQLRIFAKLQGALNDVQSVRRSEAPTTRGEVAKAGTHQGTTTQPPPSLSMPITVHSTMRAMEDGTPTDMVALQRGGEVSKTFRRQSLLGALDNKSSSSINQDEKQSGGEDSHTLVDGLPSDAFHRRHAKPPPRRFGHASTGSVALLSAGSTVVQKPTVSFREPGQPLFTREELRESAERMALASFREEADSAQSRAWSEVRKVLRRITVALRDGFEDREARANVAYERRAQWLQYQFAKELTDFKTEMRRVTQLLEARVHELSRDLDDARSDALLVRSIASKAQLKLPKPRMRATEDRKGEAEERPASRRPGKHASFRADRGEDDDDLSALGWEGGALLKRTQSRTAKDIGWMADMQRGSDTGTQTPLEWVAGGRDAASPTSPSAREESLPADLSDILDPNYVPYDAERVISDISEGKGPVAEYVRVVAQEWSVAEQHRADAEANDVLVSAIKREGVALRSVVKDLRAKLAHRRWDALLDTSLKAQMHRKAEVAAFPDQTNLGLVMEQIERLRNEMIRKAAKEQQARAALLAAGKPVGAREEFTRATSKVERSQSHGADLQNYVANTKASALAAAARSMAMAQPADETADGSSSPPPKAHMATSPSLSFGPGGGGATVSRLQSTSPTDQGELRIQRLRTERPLLVSASGDETSSSWRQAQPEAGEEEPSLPRTNSASRGLAHISRRRIVPASGGALQRLPEGQPLEGGEVPSPVRPRPTNPLSTTATSPAVVDAVLAETPQTGSWSWQS